MNKIYLIVCLIIFSTYNGIAFGEDYERAIDTRAWSFRGTMDRIEILKLNGGTPPAT